MTGKKQPDKPKAQRRRAKDVLRDLAAPSPTPAPTNPPKRQKSYLGRVLGEENEGLQARLDAMQEKYGGALPVRDIDTSDIHLSSTRFNRLELTVQPGYPLFEELVESIRATGGNKTPILVRTVSGSDGYELVYGERRWRACSYLKLPVTAIIAEGLDDASAIRLQQTENSARQSISALEHGWQVASWQAQLGYGGRIKLADVLGLDSSYISNLALIGNIPEELSRAHPDASRIPFRAARRIAVLYRDEPEVFAARLAELAPQRASLSPSAATRLLLCGSAELEPKPKPTPRSFRFSVDGLSAKDRTRALEAVRAALEPFGIEVADAPKDGERE